MKEKKKEMFIRNVVINLILILSIINLSACAGKEQEEPATGAFDSMKSQYGDYEIIINAKNPGHPSDGNVFSTYFDWTDSEDYETDVLVDFDFYSHSLSMDYVKTEETVMVGDKSCSYLSESNTKLIILYEVDADAYLKITLTANCRFKNSTGESADLDVQLADVLQSDEFKEAFSFEITKK